MHAAIVIIMKYSIVLYVTYIDARSYSYNYEV